MADDFLYDFEFPDDDFEFTEVSPENPANPADPECEPFGRLPDKTHQTQRHHDRHPFMTLVADISREVRRIPQPFEYQPYPGSGSWLGSDERIRSWLDNSNDLAIWKLCFYGKVGSEDKDYAFGVRIRYARRFERLVKLSFWEFRFKVPPNYGGHQWFVGFSVRATKTSLARIRNVIDAVIEELRDRREGQ